MLQIKTKHLLSVLLLVAVLVFAQGCDDTESPDIPTNPAVTIESLIVDGWAQLNDGETNDALFTFTEAANADAANLEAYLGLGYAYALNGEPIGAQLNLGNVLSLGAVMLESGELDETYANTLFAEACAGRASVNLSTQDFADCIAEADAAREFWALSGETSHRWLPDFSLDDIQLMKANAMYGMGEYGDALILLDEIEAGLVDEMLASGRLIEVTESVAAVEVEDTPHTGRAALNLSNENLVYVLQISRNGIRQTIDSYDQAGSIVYFRANPIPNWDDMYDISYYYADSFGEFLIDLRDVLDSLQ